MNTTDLITHVELTKQMKAMIWNLAHDELKVPVDGQLYQQLMLHVYNTISESGNQNETS